MKIALGGAQFGLAYGIANQHGQVSRQIVHDVVTMAKASGVDTIDTAIAYGDSETSLGELGVNDFKVVTKLPALPDNIVDVQAWVYQQMAGSLARLGLQNIYGLLLHRAEQLSGNRGAELAKALQALKQDGFVEKIGLSIYEPEQLAFITQTYNIDLVQAPLNLLDRRLVTSGWLQRLHDSGVEVHARSVFLQGLLLMPRILVPPKFERWGALWDNWHSWLNARDISATRACLQYVLSLPQVSRVVVGVDSAEQFRDILLNSSDAASLSEFPEISCADEDLINPSNWNSL